MKGHTLPLSLEPGLVEEAVLLAVRGSDGERRLRRRRDRLYLLSAAKREKAFNDFHLRWFLRLGLDHPIRTALSEYPLLSTKCDRCLVARARSLREEDADLLVASGAQGRSTRTVLIRLSPSHVAHPEGLMELLHRELLHACDMVDPGFGYEPTLPANDLGPSYAHLLRDRYRVLWDINVLGRLERRGKVRRSVHEEAWSSFQAAFGMLGAGTKEAFERFYGEGSVTHHDIVDFATAPRADSEGGTAAGGARCPLCRFPSFTFDPSPQALPSPVVELIVADFPGWRPAVGVCVQCADLYRARASDAACSRPANV